jgi:hypothetical protein
MMERPHRLGRFQPCMKRRKYETPTADATPNGIQAEWWRLASDPQASIKAWLVREMKTELIELHTPFPCSTKSAEASISCVPQRLVVEGTTFRRATYRTRDKWLVELIPPTSYSLGPRPQEGQQCWFLGCTNTTRHNHQLDIRTCYRKVIRTSATI